MNNLFHAVQSSASWQGFKPFRLACSELRREIPLPNFPIASRQSLPAVRYALPGDLPIKVVLPDQTGLLRIRHRSRMERRSRGR